MEKSMPVEFNHIKKMKDVREINYTDNSNAASEFPITCPLTKIEYNGLNKFIMIWSCGCVFSEKAYKEIRTSSSAYDCLVCGKIFKREDIISMNLTPEEQNSLKEKLKEEKAPKKEKSKVKNIFPHLIR